MINFTAIEILGSVFSISGAISMSLSSKDNHTPLYYAFYLFFFSNLLFLFLFTSNGMLPLMIQMTFFFISSINGILKISSSNHYLNSIFTKDFFIISFFLVLYILFFVYELFFNSTTFSGTNIINSFDSFVIKPLEVFASSLAILGSFVLSSKNHITRSYAYILFFVADSILAYIGYTHSLYAFMTQALFFLGTSSLGYYNTMKNEINNFFNIKNI